MAKGASGVMVKPQFQTKVAGLRVKIIALFSIYLLTGWCCVQVAAQVTRATRVPTPENTREDMRTTAAERAEFLTMLKASDAAGVKAMLKTNRALAKAPLTNHIPALVFAAVNGAELVTVLLEHGADPNAYALINNGLMRDYSALDVAVMRADELATAALLKAGADPMALSFGKETALQRLFQEDSDLPWTEEQKKKAQSAPAKQAVARLLMAAGANPAHDGGAQGSALFKMMGAPDRNWLVALLETAPAPDKPVAGGDTLLHLMAHHGDSEAIRLLINRKVDPNKKNGEQLTALQIVALHTAPSPATQKNDPAEPLGYWNLMAGGAEQDVFSLAAMGKLELLKVYATKHPELKALKHHQGKNLLHWATLSGQGHVIQWLLAAGLNPDEADEAGCLPLHRALERNFHEVTAILLPATRQKQMEDKQGRTPLTLAVERNNLRVIADLLESAATEEEKQGMLAGAFRHFIARDALVPLELLLKHGAKPDTVTTNGQTALHVAVRHSLMQTRWLVEKGLDVNAKDKQGLTPLHEIIRTARLSLLSPTDKLPVNAFRLGGLGENFRQEKLMIIKLLLEKGADIRAQDTNGNSVLHLVFQQDNAFSLNQHGDDTATTFLEFLLQAGSEASGVNNQGMSPLHLGITARHSLSGEEAAIKRVWQILQKHGVDIEQKNKAGMTALHLAIEKENLKFVTVLLEQKADVNARNAVGATPLMLTLKTQQAYSSDPKLLNQLLKHKANAALLDNEGRSLWQILYEDLRGRPYNSGLVLANVGISPAITNKLGQNALHLGTKHELDNGILEGLIQAGASLDIPDQEGRLPLHWLLTSKSHFWSRPAVLQKTTNINAADREGNTPLHLACLSGKMEAMESLVARGADATLRNKQGETALWLSVGKNTYANSRNSIYFRGKMQAIHLLPLGITNDIIYSASTGDLPTVKQLLSWEPRLLTVEREGHNALHAAAFANRPEVVAYLLQAGAKMDDFAAVGLGDLEFLNRSAKDRPEVWKEAEKQRELMMLAARRDNPGIIDWLVAQGGKPDETIDPHTGISALGWAMKLNLPLAVEALRRHGAKPSVFDAISLKRPELIRELTPHHAAWLSRTNESGMTPLLKAISDRDIECVKALLEAGANPNQEAGKPGLPSALLPGTPFQMALQRGHPATVDLLLQHGLDLKQRNVLGFTPLHLAAWHGSTNRIRELIERGGDINERQGKPNLPSHYQEAGQTALHLAVIRGIPSHVDFLLKNGASREITNNLGERPVDMLKTLRQPVRLGSSANGPSMNIIRMPFIHPMYPPGMVKAAAWDEIEALLRKEL